MKYQLLLIVATTLLALGILGCSSATEEEPRMHDSSATTELNCAEVRELVAQEGEMYSLGFYSGAWLKKGYTSEQIDRLWASFDACLSQGD